MYFAKSDLVGHEVKGGNIVVNVAPYTNYSLVDRKKV